MSVTEAVTLIAALSAAIVSIVGAAGAFYAAQKTASTHSLVNGLTKTIIESSVAQGNAQGKADLLTEQAKITPSTP